MSITSSGNSAHDATCLASEVTKQAADNAARATFLAGGTSAAFQTALNVSAAADFRRRIASAVANGINAEVWRQGLWEVSGSWS